MNGVVEFEYSLGESGSLTLVSSIPIQLGEWHSIKARRYHQVHYHMSNQIKEITLDDFNNRIFKIHQALNVPFK